VRVTHALGKEIALFLLKAGLCCHIELLRQIVMRRSDAHVYV
jgi:hypothetical protein